MHSIDCGPSNWPERLPQQEGRKIMTRIALAKLGVLAGSLIFAGAAYESRQPNFAPVVMLDECDPATFNAALGADFCKNVTLGASTKLADLFAKAAAGTPDPGWDFE